MFREELGWNKYFGPYFPFKNKIKHHKKSRFHYRLIFFILMGVFISSSDAFDNPFFDRIQPQYKVDAKKIKRSIKSLEKSNDIIESEILLLKEELNQKFKVRENQEIIKLSKLTGMQGYVGQGVIITLADSDVPLKYGENPNLSVVHNTDLLRIVNELWKNKATAISINAQRLSMNTEINCIGSTIMINKKRITSPFEIKAGGDPSLISNLLEKGYLKSLKIYGIKYTIEKNNMLEIPADGTIILTGEN